MQIFKLRVLEKVVALYNVFVMITDLPEKKGWTKMVLQGTVFLSTSNGTLCGTKTVPRRKEV